MPGFFSSELKRDKLGICLSILAAIGWLVFVVGFGKHQHDEDGFHFKLSSNAFVYWGVCFAGIPGIILNLVYNCTHRRGTGVLALLINIFMLVCCGGILNVTGTRINECLTNSGGSECLLTVQTSTNTSATASLDVQPYEQAEFAGSFIFTFCQTMIVLLLFYRLHGVEGYTTV